MLTRNFSPTLCSFTRRKGSSYSWKKKEKKQQQQQNGNETTTQNQHTNIYNQANSPRSGNVPVLLLREE